MITADQIACHLVGDYLLQSDWQANAKTKAWFPAIAHVVTYMLPFLVLTRSIPALAFIVGTHLLIDHYRLARYVCWIKNFLSPKYTDAGPPSELTTLADPWYNGYLIHVDGKPYRVVERKSLTVLVVVPLQQWQYSWADCEGTGYHKDRPPWMSVWLLIIADNTMHLLCNGFALTYLNNLLWSVRGSSSREATR